MGSSIQKFSIDIRQTLKKKKERFSQRMDKGAVATFQKENARFITITKQIFFWLVVGFVLLSVCLSYFLAQGKVMTVYDSAINFIVKYQIPILILYLIPFFIGSLSFLLKSGGAILLNVLSFLSKLTALFLSAAHIVSVIVVAILCIPFLYIEYLILFPGKLYLCFKALLTPLNSVEYISQMNGAYIHLGLTVILMTAVFFGLNINIQGTPAVVKYATIILVALCVLPLLVSPFIMTSRFLDMDNSGRIMLIVLIASIIVCYIFFIKNPILLVAGFLFADFYLLRRE